MGNIREPQPFPEDAVIIKKDMAFTEEELEELRQLKNRPITFDEDCPEVTPEQAKLFRRVNPRRGEGTPV